jgi:hypothetical protein
MGMGAAEVEAHYAIERRAYLAREFAVRSNKNGRPITAAEAFSHADDFLAYAKAEEEKTLTAARLKDKAAWAKAKSDADAALAKPAGQPS